MLEFKLVTIIIKNNGKKTIKNENYNDLKSTS